MRRVYRVREFFCVSCNRVLVYNSFTGVVASINYLRRDLLGWVFVDLAQSGIKNLLVVAYHHFKKIFLLTRDVA